MKRLVVWGLVVGLTAVGPVVAEAKEHGGQEHGGTAISDSKPPGLSKPDKTSKGLKKKNKTPAGLSKSKKTGRKKKR